MRARWLAIALLAACGGGASKPAPATPKEPPANPPAESGAVGDQPGKGMAGRFADGGGGLGVANAGCTSVENCEEVCKQKGPMQGPRACAVVGMHKFKPMGQFSGLSDRLRQTSAVLDLSLACIRNVAEACRFLGDAYAQNAVYHDPAVDAESDKGDPEAVQRTKDSRDPAKLYKKACDLGDKTACSRIHR